MTTEAERAELERELVDLNGATLNRGWQRKDVRERKAWIVARLRELAAEMVEVGA